jgi:hypothetical protein
VFDLGEKQWINEPSETPNADDSADVAESRRMRTGLAKRLEWPETSSRVLLDLLERANSIEKSTPAAVDGEARARHWRQRLAGHWSELGAIGFDLGLWDMVAKGQRRGLQPGDNEPFYQLLITSPQWSSAETETEELPLRELLLNPQDLVGQTFQFHATIKQVTKVPSDPGDRAAQLGLGEYYLLHGVIQLPRPLRLKFDGQRQIEYQRHFPLVIATTQLPAGLAVGDQIRQWVRGDGRLFKLWSYQSLRSQEAGVDQLAPLLVASHVRLAGPPTDGTAPWPISGLLLIPVGMGLLFLLFFGFYGLRRRS